MYIGILSALATLVVAGLATPSVHHVVHEKRDMHPTDWAKKDRVDSGLVVPVKIGLTQSNLDRGHDELMRVSDPQSPDFGKHWTLDEITDFFAPSQESIDSITEWLSAAGIHPSRIAQAKGRGWINFNADIQELEDLLQTQYHYYEHTQTGATHMACEEYSVPKHVQNHIDLILPTIQFSSQIHYNSLKKRNSSPSQVIRPGRIVQGPGPELHPGSAPTNSTCGEYITPTCLRTLYGLPKGKLNLSSYGIVEYQDAYSQQDLNLFFSNTSLNDAGVPNGTSPTFEAIDGGYLPPFPGGESDLDLEYAMTLVYPQQVTLFQVGDNGKDANNISFNNFLDALDASYCTYDGGDDPAYDEIFPDPGGYEGTENCGTRKATAVISTSYLGVESTFSIPYATRQCHEYMKLGMAGTSFLYASGDYGVAGEGDVCKNRFGHLFGPGFPLGCPYVTAVGGTQLPSANPPTGPESAMYSFEMYSGGGFSDVFPLPSYQKDAVHNYYAKYAPPYTSAQYNNSQRVRGFPDVSANGAMYMIALDDGYGIVSGTSASTPTFGAVITLINNERALKGKGPLGFLNPSLYANPDMFNDIVNGTNPGCGTSGFKAVPGWDPVTGLGTPKYDKMSAYLIGLP